MTDKVKRARRKIWQFPWSYQESFIIAFSLLIVGFLAEYFSPTKAIQLPSYPVNLFVLLIFIVFLVLTQIYLKNPIITWFSSVPAAMSAMTVYTFLILFMGFIPQEVDNTLASQLGFTFIKASKPFIIISVFMLTILGYIIVKRLRQKVSLRNFAFFLNHAGLFIIITTASLGSGDLIRLRLPVYENESSNMAIYDTENMAKLPFHIHLDNFNVEEFPPQLVIFDKKSGMPKITRGGKFPKISEGITVEKYGFEIFVKDFIDRAFPTEHAFFEKEHFGTTHAAFLEVKSGNKTIEGWISCGNFMFNPRFLELNEKYAIGMSVPKVREYKSIVDISRNGVMQLEDISITVNKPLKYDNWNIYQFGYDSDQGRWSKLSIFELIRDPWLPVVYVGIYMVLFGSLYLLWVGRKIN